MSAMQDWTEACAKDQFVVIAGCGGGCDVYGGLIPFHGIRPIAKHVVLVNLSFTKTFDMKRDPNCCEIIPGRLYRADPRAPELCAAGKYVGATNYYPERFLADEIQHPVYVLSSPLSQTVTQFMACYQEMVKLERSVMVSRDPSAATCTNTLLLVDGGSDVLLRGDEEGGLATPVEDMFHLKTTRELCEYAGGTLFRKAFVCAIGANVDYVHGILPKVLDDRIATLMSGIQKEPTSAAATPGFWARVGSWLGVAGSTAAAPPAAAAVDAGGAGEATAGTTEAAPPKKALVPLSKLLTMEDACAAFYRAAVLKCSPELTIVQSLTVAAIEGHRDLYTPEWLVPRIGRNKVPLSDLTATFFVFDHQRISDDVLYLPGITRSTTGEQVSVVLRKFLTAIGRH